MEKKEQIASSYIKKTYLVDDIEKSGILDGFNQSRIAENVRTSQLSPRGNYESRYPATLAIDKQFDNKKMPQNSPRYNLSPLKIQSISRSNYEEPNNLRDFNVIRNQANSAYPNSYDNQYSQTREIHSTHNQTFLKSPYTNPIYEQSSNYNLGNSKLLSHQSPTKNSRSIMELQKLVSQLKISLQQSLSSQQILQEQLQKQRTKTFQLSEIKRKLQQQLSRMQFQLNRISDIDVLSLREVVVKYQAQVKENERLSCQFKDTVQELRKIKNQSRELMTENSKLREECEILRNSNQSLTAQIDSMAKETSQVKRDYSELASRQKEFKTQNEYLANSHLKNSNASSLANPGANLHYLNTERSNNLDFGYLSNPGNISNLMKHDIYSQAEQNFHTYDPALFKKNRQQIDIDREGSKLIDDYNKLFLENEWMKKRQMQANQHIPQFGNNIEIIPSPNSSQKLNKIPEIFSETNQNLGERDFNDQKILTFQKNEMSNEVFSIRDEVIRELMTRYFNQALNQAEKKKANALVIFIKLVSKDLQVIEKMVLNYLQARDLLKKQFNFNQNLENDEANQLATSQQEAQNKWLTVKQKLKLQLKPIDKTLNKVNTTQIISLNINAYFLALFRLLTLIQKYEKKIIETSSKAMSKIKHSALKYIHKIHEQSMALRNNENSQGLKSKRSPQKAGLLK